MPTGGGRSRRGRELEVNAEINVTSLIDVAFTLLVIFIITAPIMQGGIEVRLPQARIQPVQPTSDPMVVTVLEGGTVVIGETPFSAGEFEEAFTPLFQAANPSIVYIRGDSLATHGRIMPVIGVVAELAAEAGIGWRLVAQEAPPR